MSILQSAFAVEIVYPFLLVFVLVFAILQKTKLLGEDQRQINALISLAISLIFIAFGSATGIVVNLIPWLAVGVVVLLVFFVLLGFVMADNEKGFVIPKGVQIGLGVLIGIFVIIAVIVATGQWDMVTNLFFNRGEITGWATNVLLVAIIVGALAVVIFSGKGKKD